jgi:hypothetical protein
VNKIWDAFLEVKVELTAVGVISLCYLMNRQPKETARVAKGSLCATAYGNDRRKGASWRRYLSTWHTNALSDLRPLFRLRS